MTNEISKYKHNLDINDLNSISSYGFDLQEKLGRESTSLSSDLKTADYDEIGEQLVDLTTEITSINIGEIKTKGLLGFLKKNVKKGKLNIVAIQSQYDSVSVTVDKIASELANRAQSLGSDNDTAQQMMNQNQNYQLEIRSYIDELKLAKSDLKEKLKTSEDDFEKGRINRSLDIMSRREKDLASSLALARTQHDSLQLAIAGNIELIQDLHTAIHTAIPTWKSNLNLRAIIHNQEVGVKVKAAISETTNAMIKSNADTIRNSAVAIADESNRSVVDVETIEYAQNAMLDAIKQVSAKSKNARAINDAQILKLEQFEDKNKTILKALEVSPINAGQNNEQGS